MIEMNVMGIALDTRTGTPIVVLNDLDNRKALPIWIGSAEASSIIRKIENIPSTRPMTHDLFVDFVDQMNGELKYVEITDVNEQTYFATIVIENMNGEEIYVDSRPSDAISIALRAKAPIYVSTEVMARGAISVNSEKDKQEEEEFKNFIQEVKPSDFEKLINKNFESDT
ncbi:bifunctional nuclease family protein [bacterium]|nr:bifunctional nuclease family protein [bacterium]